MIWNGESLLKAAPINDMVERKMSAPGGTSFGLVEAGYDIRIVFHELKEPGDYGNGKYQDQENRPVKARSTVRYLGGKK